MRSFTFRPWLAGLTLGAVGLFAAAYVGATGYLVYRDDLLGATVARQVSIQYDYEERIAALRSEIDRVTSRHIVETQGVDEQLMILLERQSLIERRQAALDDLIMRAEAAGISVAAANDPRLPKPRPSPEVVASPAIPAVTPALAYAPQPAISDIIGETLIRGSDGKTSVRLREDVRPVLKDVQVSLEAATVDQAHALDALDAAAQKEIDRLSAALGPIGVEVSEAMPDGPSGGPFIPDVQEVRLHFVERTAVLRRTLDDIAAAKRAANAMPLLMPVRAQRISSRFGYRLDPFRGKKALHAGVDFVAPEGTNVRATAAGTVISAGWNGGYGFMVEIRHAAGVTTRYGHLSKILVAKGTQVDGGALIGRVGSTGRSTGPHLHYETRYAGKAVDPAVYLAAGRALRPTF